jgi:cytosine/adenosine deaminase-related metal-dependent hydrolase
MPAPPKTPTSFREILEQVWWRLDCALDLEMLRWSAMLGAVEALAAGCTAIVDHHESPNAIDGSLSVIAEACAEVGVRVSCAYGVTDRHGPDGAQRGLAENERFLRAGGRGMVGVHAAFTCSDDTLRAAAGLAADLGVGVHIHVAEGVDDVGAGRRLARLAAPEWLLVHCVHLDEPLPGTIAHNPRSNMNNAVGYARPTRFAAAPFTAAPSTTAPGDDPSTDPSTGIGIGIGNPVVLGTDGIGADMLDEFRLAYLKLRESDVTATPQTPWGWLENGWTLFPEARTNDTVTWSYEHADDPWCLAFTTGVHPTEVSVDGEIVWRDGLPTRVDVVEIRAKAAEQARRLFVRL